MPNGARDYGFADFDEWYKQGIKAGAKGGKLLGAGNRGFLMFLLRLKNIEISQMRWGC